MAVPPKSKKPASAVKKNTRRAASKRGHSAAGRPRSTGKSEAGQGELKIVLPDQFDAGLYFIGRIRTPWTRHQDCPKSSGESDAVCTILVDECYAAALAGVESCTHLVVLYWMHQARRDLLLQRPRRYLQHLGTFALRSPVRPNPIAASVVRVHAIDGSRISVVGLDCVDGTPLVDIKPYFAATDAVPDAVVGWHARSDKTYVTLRDQLRAGEFGSGRALPETKLATQLGVSRTPLREALLRLAGEGLLDADGSGFVSPMLSRADVDEIYALRLLMEPEAVRQVAGKLRGRAWLKSLRGYLAAMADAHAAGDTDAFIDANDAYRATWLKLVPNQRLLRTIELYADHVRYLRLFTLSDRSTQTIVITGLGRLTAAFAAAKPDDAAAVLHEHLGAARAALLAALDAQSVDAAPSNSRSLRKPGRRGGHVK